MSQIIALKNEVPSRHGRREWLHQEESGVSLRRASEIMGRDYVPLLPTVDPSSIKFVVPKELSRVIVTPKDRLIGERELLAARGTHVLILIPRGSIMSFREMIGERYNTPIFADEDWYASEEFATREGVSGWHLIRKNLLDVGLFPDWSRQRGLMGPDEETPSTRVMTHFLVRYYLATGFRLHPNAFARCVDSGTGKCRGKVGYFGREGLRFGKGNVCQHSCAGNIGLAAAKKQ